MRTWNEPAALMIGITLLLTLNPNLSRAQQELLAPAASQAAAKSRLLEEAERVEVPHFALRAAKSPEAAELAHQLEVFAKEIEVAWLKRGLEDTPLPADMSARLSPEGAAHRKKFVSHLEEIATLTLSDPILSSQKPSRKGQHTSSGGAEQQQNNLLPQATPPINQQGRDGEGEASLAVYAFPVHNRFKPIDIYKAREIAQFTTEQTALDGKLDELTRSVLKYWGRKNLDLSIRESERPSHAMRFRQSIIDLSNRVIFSAILRPEQAEKLKRAIWVKQGPDCLLDPEIASRIGINKEQRAMIQTALDQSLQAQTDYRSKVENLINRRSSDRLVKEQNQEIIESIKQNRNENNQAVWDLLTPSQTSKIRALLEERASKAKPPRQENPSRPAPAS